MGVAVAGDTAVQRVAPDLSAHAAPAGWTASHRDGRVSSRWERSYLRVAAVADVGCGLAGGAVALVSRFTVWGYHPPLYLVVTPLLPVLWVLSVALARGYDVRFIGTGPEEFRRILNAGVGLTAAIAILAFVAKIHLARSYVVIALPSVTMLDLLARYRLRKALHLRRRRGRCMRRVVAVGHPAGVADLVAELRREKYHGLAVVGACLTQGTMLAEISGVPVLGGVGSVPGAVAGLQADTVAVVASRDLNGLRLRELAWELEATGTDLCVAPALLDVAGPRTSIRPVAGLPLLYVEHPEFSGVRWIIKSLFDKVTAAAALLVLAPLLLGIALIIAVRDGRPVLFRQSRVGKDGQTFTLYKFRTMVVDAERQKAALLAQNEGGGLLFKLRDDPRVTRTGSWLRRWSLDELPQLLNVIKGDMSVVGPRPPLPDEVARYTDYVRRRLVVKPGITGLWQVSGRSDLSWEEAVRLDLRYVENWSFVLDLQILWKSLPAVLRGSGAY
jgi:exopolysaccharide biosynthesis polyprenyl glycosylphosphotransferase